MDAESYVKEIESRDIIVPDSKSRNIPEVVFVWRRASWG
jgi:hypothetical protein